MSSAREREQERDSGRERDKLLRLGVTISSPRGERGVLIKALLELREPITSRCDSVTSLLTEEQEGIL